MRPVLVALAAVLVVAAAGSGPAPASAPLGRYLVATRALWAEFEQPASPRGWYTGQLFDQMALSVVRAEVARQLDHMRALGVNEILLEMRTAGGDTPPPWSDCDLSPELGPSWPQPTTQELNGLRAVLELARTHGMRVMLILNNSHMEEQPPLRSQRWLGAVLGAVKDSPALDLIAFGGDRQTIDAKPPYDGVPDSCGGQAEAPLWLGPDSIQARHVRWAIGYAMSLGLPPQKLTAEAIVGYYPHEIEQGAGPDAQDRHLWRPLEVMRTIFDRLGIDASQRTYALSYYEHPKCAFVDRSFTTCEDEDEFAWTEETLRLSRARIATQSRLTVAEWGVQPSEPAISRTVEHFGVTLQRLGLEGGVYWKWSDSAAADGPYATNPEALVKVRGAGFRYHAVAKEIADLYGFHVTAVANGSFEEGATGWTVRGSAQQLPLDEPAPWRGKTFLRVRGSGSVVLKSAAIRVTPSTVYTVTTRHRGQRGHVTVHFLTCAQKQSKLRRRAAFQFARSAGSFATFPVRFKTPKDVCFVRVEIGATGSIDVDDVR